MIADDAIRNEWHVVYRSRDLDEGAIRPIRLLGEDLVLWRSGGGGHGLARPLHPSRLALFDGQGAQGRDGVSPITAGATTATGGAR